MAEDQKQNEEYLVINIASADDPSLNSINLNKAINYRVQTEGWEFVSWLHDVSTNTFHVLFRRRSAEKRNLTRLIDQIQSIPH